MRAFIAIDLTEQVRESFRRIENRLMTSDADVKWVKPGNAHLTLKFLGEIEEEVAEKINDCLSEIANHQKIIEIAFSDLGFFPNERRPRVIWVGISKGADNLKDLAREIDEKISALGLPKEERGFSPHLTLGRFRSPRNLTELTKLVEKSKGFDAGRLVANSIHLIESVLQPAGPVYTKLFSVQFLKTP